MAAYMLDNAGDGINPCRAARTYTILNPAPTTQLETLTISDSHVFTKLASTLVAAAQIDFFVEVTITIAKEGGDVTIKKVAMFRVNAVDCQIESSDDAWGAMPANDPTTTTVIQIGQNTKQLNLPKYTWWYTCDSDEATYPNKRKLEIFDADDNNISSSAGISYGIVVYNGDGNELTAASD